MPHDGRAAQAFQDADLDFLRPERDEAVKAGGETFERFAGQSYDQVGVNMHAGFAAQEMKVVRELVVVLPAADESAHGFVEGLDADFKLQRARRKFGDGFAQGFRQPVGDHFKVEEMSGLIACEKKIENGFADADVQVEGAVHKLELPHAAINQSLHLFEQDGQRNLAHGNVERRQAKLAGERTAARGFDVDDPMRNVVVGVEIVRQLDAGKVGQFGGNDFGQS